MKAVQEQLKTQVNNSELRQSKFNQELFASHDTVQRAQITHAQQIAQAEAHVQAIIETEDCLHYQRFAEKAEQGEAIADLQESFIESVAENQACCFAK